MSFIFKKLPIGRHIVKIIDCQIKESKIDNSKYFQFRAKISRSKYKFTFNISEKSPKTVAKFVNTFKLPTEIELTTLDLVGRKGYCNLGIDSYRNKSFTIINWFNQDKYNQ